MTQARRSLVCVEETPYYHCVGRCVRRAFLCGGDPVSGRSYEHRRAWMQARLALLAEVFAVDICAYALMSNHYHLVLKLCPARAGGFSDEAVIDRWTQLFTGPPLVHRYRRGECVGEGEAALARAIVSEWRARLSDLSWFMRCLNEYIARRANAEDGVTGHFWEARFKSQALLDDVALLTGMVYVDLNPIRAAIATSVQDSAYTSARQRFQSLMGVDAPDEGALPCPRLASFQTTSQAASDEPLPFGLTDYLDLVDATGRVCRSDKAGFIGASVPRLLEHLKIDASAWVNRMGEPQSFPPRAIGAPEKLRAFARRLRQHWIRGVATASALYPA